MRDPLHCDPLIQAQYIVLDAFCREAATYFAECGLTSIGEIHLPDLAVVRRDLETALEILHWEVESGARHPGPSGGLQSPPPDFDSDTRSDTLECPICYRLVADKGFTECQHRLCPYCLEQHVRHFGRSCPICRRGLPTDNVMAEVARLLESLEYEDRHRVRLGT